MRGSEAMRKLALLFILLAVRLFAALRVVRYEDADAVGDFGQQATRVVRLAAVKP